MGGSGIDLRARSIRVTFTWNGKQERRTIVANGQPLAPSPANLKYAERLAAEIREKIRLGMFVMADYFPASGNTADGLTLEQQFKDCIASQRIEDSTKAGYESAARFWTLAMPGKLVRSLKHSDILKVMASRPDLTGKTINNYASVLRETLDLAVRDRIIKENPMEGVPRAKHQKSPPDPFTREESDQILALALQRHPGQVHNLLEFWFWTGMRTSEVFGLTWDHVDLASGTLLVTEALVRGKRKTTKTATARTVRLNSKALAAIQRQRQYTQVAGGPVFQDPRFLTGWSDERAFRRSFWTPMLKSLGLRYRRPYNMRHSYATAMLMAGMTPAFCAKQLGHSVDIFLRTYAKWTDGTQDDTEMQRLEAGLSPAYPQKQIKAP